MVKLNKDLLEGVGFVVAYLSPFLLLFGFITHDKRVNSKAYEALITQVESTTPFRDSVTAPLISYEPSWFSEYPSA